MRLTPISSQAGTDFRRRYLELAEDPSWRQRGSMMAKIVEHLEANVVGPDCWAYTSHEELVLNDKDTYHNHNALVTIKADVPDYVPRGYEIAYRVKAPWFRVTGYTEDVEVAGEMIVDALERAARDDAEATG